MYDYIKKKLLVRAARQRTLAVCSQFPFVGAAKSHPVNKNREMQLERMWIFRSRRDIDIYVCGRSRQAREKLNPAEEWFLALCFAQEVDIKCGHCGLISILNPRCGESHLPGHFLLRQLMVFLLKWVIARNGLFGATHSAVARRS